MKRTIKYVLTSILFLQGFLFVAQADNYFSIPAISAEPDENITLNVHLQNTGNVAGFQFRLSFPSGTKVEVSNPQLTARKDNHTLSFKDLGNNQYVFVCYSITNAVFSGSDGAVLNMQVHVPATYNCDNTYPVSFSEVVISDNLGNDITGTSTGTNISIHNAPISNSEYQILRNLFIYTSGSHWKNQWNITSNDAHNGNWYGVVVSDCHIRSIDLQSNNLKGKLPDLSGLSYLTALDLSQNALDDLEPTLPAFANIESQTIQKGLLVINPEVEQKVLLPKICVYNKQSKSFTAQETFSVSLANIIKGTGIQATTDGYLILPASYFANFQDNQELKITQETGAAKGTEVYYTLKLCSPIGEISNMSPNNNIFNNLTIAFNWGIDDNISEYDWYIWEENAAIPQTPTVSNIIGNSYTYTNGILNYNKKYFWKLIAKNPCDAKESAVLAFSIGSPPGSLPDLHVTEVHTSSPNEGGTLTVTYTVKNDGLGATPSGQTWRDWIYISPDIDVRTGDPASTLLLQAQNLMALNPGESYTNTVDVKLPQGRRGNYYIFVFSNQSDAYSINFGTAGGIEPIPYTPSITGIPYPYLTGGTHYSPDIQETNAKDNFFYTLIYITPAPTPDLIVSSISQPTNCYSGVQIPVTYTVTNQGKAQTQQNSWFDAIYISPDATLNMSNAVYLGAFKHNGILPVSDSYTQTQMVEIPISFTGDYHIFCVADVTDVVYEGLYNDNNTSVSPVILSVTLSPPCDLTVTEVTAPQSASVYEKVTINYTVKNIGMNITPTNQWVDRVYISPSPDFNINNAIALMAIPHSQALPIDGTYSNQADVIIPDNIKGDYYIFVKTDSENQVFEYTYKDNNIARAASSVSILVPDLVVEQVTVPTAVIAGEQASISYKVKNAGEGKLLSRSWSDNIYFNNIAVNKIEKANITLQPGDLYTQQVTFTIPCDLQGNNTIKIVTDAANVIFESDENNNSYTQTVTAIAPDLAAGNLQTSASANSGYTIDISYQISNIGNAPVSNKTLTDRIYLSNTPTLNMQTATLLGKYSRNFSLDASATATVNTTVQIPNGIQGKYYFFAVVNADTLVCEGAALANNRTGGNAVQVILSAAPDLYIASFQVDDILHIGYTNTLNYIIENKGDTIIENKTWSEKVYLSNSATFSPQSVLLGENRHTSSLGIDETEALSVSFVIPTTVKAGYYYIHIIANADNDIYEHNYASNNITGKVIEVKSYPIDIAATAIDAPETANWGEDVSVVLTVENISQVSTLINGWADNVYLSSDNIFDNNDIALSKGVQHIGVLQAGNSYQTTFRFTVPYGKSGDMYLIGYADPDDKNVDIDPTNNRFVKAITINSIPVPDLQIDSLELLAPCISGQPVQVTYRVKNIGAGATPNVWSDKIYLSSDNTLSGATELVTYNRPSGLQPGESRRDTLTITVPIPNQGNRFLLAKTNITGSFYESNTANNLTAIPIYVTLPPPCDLIVEDITMPETITAGAYWTAQWKVSNTGTSSASGSNLREVAYLSEDQKFDVTDKLLGTLSSNLSLAPNASEQHSLTARVSGVKEGYYYLIVKTNALRAFNESNYDNNTGVSTYPVFVSLKNLPVNTPLPDNLFNNLANDYKLATDTLAGETILLTVQSSDSLRGAVNNLYVKNNDAADNIRYDMSSDGQSTANPQIYLPSAVPDYYGVAVQGETPVSDRQDIVLQANVLPFMISKISPDYGGNTGKVTIEITGSKFAPTTQYVYLQQKDTIGEDVLPYNVFADTVIYVSRSKMYAVFDLTDKKSGTYSINADDYEQFEYAYLPDAFVVTETKENLSYDLLIPNNPRPNRVIAMTLIFENTGNIDLENRKLEIESITGSPMALTMEDMTAGNTVTTLQIPCSQSVSNQLRPQEQGSVIIFVKTTNGLVFSIVEIK